MVNARNMFGDAVIYHDGVFFSLVADNTRYLKVNDGNRTDYEGQDRPF